VEEEEEWAEEEGSDAQCTIHVQYPTQARKPFLTASLSRILRARARGERERESESERARERERVCVCVCCAWNNHLWRQRASATLKPQYQIMAAVISHHLSVIGMATLVSTLA